VLDSMLLAATSRQVHYSSLISKDRFWSCFLLSHPLAAFASFLSDLLSHPSLLQMHPRRDSIPVYYFLL
jgi:hypothetical protein